MDTSEAVGGLQLTVAGLGAVALALAGLFLWAIDSGPETGGHMAGFAVVIVAIVGWLGLLAVGVGLRIPAGEELGITFSRGQRYCFLASTLGTVGVVAVPVVSLVVGVDSFRLPYYATMGSLYLAVATLVLGVLWRAGTAIARRYDVITLG